MKTRPTWWMVLVLSAGCGSELPPLREEPGAGTETSGAERPGAPSPARRLLRADVRQLYGQCEDQRQVLQRTVDEARDTEVRWTTLAVAAQIAGEALSSTSHTERTVRIDERGRAEPGTGPTPNPASATPTREEARRRLDAINAAIDEIDTFLVDHPEPDEWTDEGSEMWTILRARLAHRCGAE